MLSATLEPRNATSARKEMTVATLLPSVPPLAESHTESATQELESAHHVTHLRTRSAPKLRKLATKNVPHNHSQNATSSPVSARPAKTVPAVSQLLLVNKPASQDHQLQQTTNTTANGMLISQHANKIHKVP